MMRLFAESFAPWCEKARWALDHHGIEYRYTEHMPLVGEPALRWAARKPFGHVTVPLLVDGPEVLADSFDIARHAEKLGKAEPLFPQGLEDTVTEWNARSEAVMVAGRAMLLPRMAADDDALAEQLPPGVPRALRPALAPGAVVAVRYLARKYGVAAEDAARHEAASREALDALRRALAGGQNYLLGDKLSYADIAMAASLQFVRPVDDKYIALGPATRHVWTHPELSGDYADLLSWRDGLYARSRATSQKRS